MFCLWQVIAIWANNIMNDDNETDHEDHYKDHDDHDQVLTFCVWQEIAVQEGALLTRLIEP